MIFETVRIRSSEDLIAALRARRIELGLKHLEVDDLGGLQGGYTGKLECGAKNIGLKSLSGLLAALGAELALVRSSERSAASFDIEAPAAQPETECPIKKKMAALGAKGGRRRWGSYLPGERKTAMRKLGLASGKARRKRGVSAQLGFGQIETHKKSMDPKSPMD